MKLHLRYDKGNSSHQEVTMFLNGRNVGKLTMSPAEATWFNIILEKGCNAISPEGLEPIEIISSGKCYYPSEDTPLYTVEEASK